MLWRLKTIPVLPQVQSKYKVNMFFSIFFPSSDPLSDGIGNEYSISRKKKP